MVFVLVRLIRHLNMQWLVLPKIQGLCMMTNINPFGAARQQLALVAAHNS
ncbi:hypothetical protein FHR92_004836 [Fontibacillus solani]|uniref:Uncharacterized protein n=1 Tax=Fontibacillus solani TaxID=1572857 RepID=A0A7W3XU63_9BACL|nr:hypothetical protein [Fontibacillus solani]